MSDPTNVRELNPFWIIAAYGIILIVLLGSFVLMEFIYQDAEYTPEWIPDASKTVMDIVKVVIGAIIGTLTPTAANAARAQIR